MKPCEAQDRNPALLTSLPDICEQSVRATQRFLLETESDEEGNPHQLLYMKLVQ